MPSNPFRVIQTGVSTDAGYTATYFPDYSVRPFNIGIGCVVNSTGITYSVQHSFDPIASAIYGSSIATVASTAATWFNNSVISGLSTNADTNYAFPVTAIRIAVTAGSSTGTLTMSAIQAG